MRVKSCVKTCPHIFNCRMAAPPNFASSHLIASPLAAGHKKTPLHFSLRQNLMRTVGSQQSPYESFHKWGYPNSWIITWKILENNG